MLSGQYGFKYVLDHIRNGDFDRGTAGWTLFSAAVDSMALRSMPDSGSMMHFVMMCVVALFLGVAAWIQAAETVAHDDPRKGMAR